MHAFIFPYFTPKVKKNQTQKSPLSKRFLHTNLSNLSDVYRSLSQNSLARGQGIEPRFPGPEPGVLPLYDPRINYSWSSITSPPKLPSTVSKILSSLTLVPLISILSFSLASRAISITDTSLGFNVFALSTIS